MVLTIVVIHQGCCFESKAEEHVQPLLLKSLCIDLTQVQFDFLVLALLLLNADVSLGVCV